MVDRDVYDFTALTISKVKTKPKERVMKIYATRKDKEDDIQRTKDKVEKEEKHEKEKDSNSKRNDEEQTVGGLIVRKDPKKEDAMMEAAEFEIEALF